MPPGVGASHKPTRREKGRQQILRQLLEQLGSIPLKADTVENTSDF